ncbi:MAG: GTP-binding protein [Burkholderiaceae bacterium]
MTSSEPSKDSLIPVSVLTGFLGSGKTTMLSQWISQPEFANTLVVINEFGQIGLDHRLVTQSEDSATVVMDSGCICCTIRTDLVQTLDQARWRFARQGSRQFDRVVIETTGLADPAPIVQTLATEDRLTRHYRLQSVITAVDGVLGEQTLADHYEAQKQVAIADQLVLTKADLFDSTSTEHIALQTRLRQLNPIAPVCVVAHGRVPVSILGAAHEEVTHMTRVAQLTDHGHSHDGGHSHEINALCLLGSQPLDHAAVEQWQRELMAVLGADLFRFKAIVAIDGAHGMEWLTFQSVQHKAMPCVPIPAPKDRLHDKSTRSYFVLIGRDLSFDRLKLIGTNALKLELAGLDDNGALA